MVLFKFSSTHKFFSLPFKSCFFKAMITGIFIPKLVSTCTQTVKLNLTMCVQIILGRSNSCKSYLNIFNGRHSSSRVVCQQYRFDGDYKTCLQAKMCYYYLGVSHNHWISNFLFTADGAEWAQILTPSLKCDKMLWMFQVPPFISLHVGLCVKVYLFHMRDLVFIVSFFFL